MSSARVLATAVAISLLLHLLLMLLVPGLRLRFPIDSETLVEVEVEVEPTPVQPPAPAPAPAPKPEPEPLKPPEAPESIAPEEVLPLPAATAAELQRALGPWSAASAPPPPAAPRISLPARDQSLPSLDAIPYVAPPPRGPVPLPRVRRPAADLPPGPDVSELNSLVDSLLADSVPTATPTPIEKPEPLRDLEIEGPAGRRKVVHRPALPSVAIRNPVDVTIKFYVSPRGDVVRALPEQRGDAVLDRAALEYVKAFRFDSLPPGDEQEQWGTIRVRFRLR